MILTLHLCLPFVTSYIFNDNYLCIFITNLQTELLRKKAFLNGKIVHITNVVYKLTK